MTKPTASALADKLRRAQRNNTGAQFSNAELRALAEFGVLHMLAKAEADEIIATWHPEQERERANTNPTVFSVRTLAERWQCSEGLIRKMIGSGELRSFRYGNLIRIAADAVAEIESKVEGEARRD
jgi:excisionase family DNA binding protein